MGRSGSMGPGTASGLDLGGRRVHGDSIITLAQGCMNWIAGRFLNTFFIRMNLIFVIFLFAHFKLKPYHQAKEAEMDFDQKTSTAQGLTDTRRLLVLVSDLDVDETVLGHSVWDIARPAKLDVLYLCVIRHWDDELQAFHKTTRLCAVTHDPRIHVESLLKGEIDVFKAITDVYRTGDLIICDESQEISKHIFWRKSLSKALTDKLHVPVMPISYLHHNGKMS